MNKIFKHKRGASGLKVVCEFAKSHCSSGERTAINSGAHISTRTGFKGLSIALISALTFGCVTPAVAQTGANLGGSGATVAGDDSTAGGNNAKASAKGSTAIGQNAEASHENSISIGNESKSIGKSSINIGGGNKVDVGENTILMGGGGTNVITAVGEAGKTNDQKITNTTIIGSNNKIHSEKKMDRSIIMGSRHEINQGTKGALGQNVIIGEKQTIDDSEQATTIGNDIVASGARGGVAIGGDDGSTGIYRQTKIFGKHTIAIGAGAQALMEGAMTLGVNAQASGKNSTALGKLSYTTTEDGVALGSKSFADTDKGIKGLDFTGGGQGIDSTQTSETWQSTLAAVSLGGKEHKASKDKMDATATINTRQITNLAAGTKDTDAVNVAQLKSLGTYAKNVDDKVADVNKKVTKIGDDLTKAKDDLAKVEGSVKTNTDNLEKLTKDIKDGTSVFFNAEADDTKGINTAKQVKNATTIKFAGDGENNKDGNIKTSITQANNGKTTVKFALNETDLKIGKKTANGSNGVDGKFTVSGKDGSSVEIDGKDGKITAKDKDGKDGVTINGKDGSIGLTKDGTNTTIALKKDGQPDVNGANGIKMSRLTYTTPKVNGATGEDTHEIATLDDGLKFAGNTTGKTITKKLNDTLTIKGGATNSSDTTDKNIWVETDTTSSTLNIKMAKVLKDLTSAEFASNNGKTKIDGDGITYTPNASGNGTVSLGKDGINAGGKTISNVGLAKNDTDAMNKKETRDMVDNAIGDLKKHIQNGTNIYFNAEADNTNMNGVNTPQKVANTKNIKFEGDGNIETSVTQDTTTGKTTVKFTLNTKDLNFGGKKDGKDGKISLNGADGKSGVEIDGKDGKITAKDKDGKEGAVINGKDHTIVAKGDNGKDGVTINGKDGSIGLTKDGTNGVIIKGEKGDSGVNGTNGIDRIVYTDKNGNNKHQVATLDDGLKFAGNAGTANVKLNQRFEIKGAESHNNNEWLRDFDQGKNIMTKVDGFKTTIALAKNLSGLNSATFESNSNGLIKKVRISDEGIKFETQQGNNKSKPGVSIDHNGINAGEKTIKNVADAVKSTDAVNKGQLDKAIKDGLASGGASALTLAGDEGDARAIHNKVTISGGQADTSKLSDKSNIGVVAKDGKLDIKLAKDIDVDSVKANKITAGGVTIENGKISGVQSSLDPKGELAKKLAEIDKSSKTGIEKAKEKKAAIQEALQKAKQDNVATVGDLKNVTNGLDSVVENVTNITNNITNITNMVANSDDKKKIDEASKAIEEYKKDQNDKNKQKAAEDAINANKIKTYNPYGTTVKNNTTIVDAIKNINERGVKFMHISDSDKVGENDDLSVNNNDSQANKKGSIGIGMNAVSDGADAIATGTDSKASGANAIAMGKGAQAMGENTISIGTGNKVTGRNSGAIGDPTEIINADGTYSVGNNNNIKGGDKTTAKDIFALGNDIGSKTTPITDKANGSVILGSKGYSNVKNGVALGYGSNADRDALTDKTSAYNGNDTGVQNTIKGTYGAVSVGDKDNTRQIINVAAGKEDSDAVNVAQLKAVANQIKNVSGGQWIAVSNGAKTAPQVANNVKNAVAVGDGSVANRDNTFSVGSAGNERIISNVADGVAPTDAANMRQLQSVANMVGEVKKDAMAGTASAMAIGNLPQATIPGKGMMAVGVGFYKGEQATALGVSKMSENGRWVFKASASYDSQRNVGAAGAIGFHF